MPEREFAIALSFAGEDRVYVDQVANGLRDSGVTVFYDLFEEESLWGKNLYDYLSDIYMNKALFTIMFISEAYARKLWTNHERQAMQARAFQENQEYILPARFDETPIPGVLPTVGYISLEDKTPAEFVKTIHRKLVNSGQTVPSVGVPRPRTSIVTVPKITPTESSITVLTSEGEPVVGASVVAIADNNTTLTANTDDTGVAKLSISTRRTYQLLIVHNLYPGIILPTWDSDDDIEAVVAESENTGSAICLSTCHLPNIQGRLSPILDSQNRTYLYADNIAIDGGKNQPVTFQIDEPIELEDCHGNFLSLTVLHIQGRTSLLEFVCPNYEE